MSSRNNIHVSQTPTFARQVKKLHANQKKELDSALFKIMIDPDGGDLKKGDLLGVRLFKCKINNQLILIAYEWRSEDAHLVLLALGSHENFYRDLKR